MLSNSVKCLRICRVYLQRLEFPVLFYDMYTDLESRKCCGHFFFYIFQDWKRYGKLTSALYVLEVSRNSWLILCGFMNTTREKLGVFPFVCVCVWGGGKQIRNEGVRVIKVLAKYFQCIIGIHILGVQN